MFRTIAVLQTPGRIGIDVGGTFTDAVIVVDDGSVRIAKVRSTPERIEAGFMDGLEQLLERAGSTAADVGYLAHGSTVATNAIVQRRLARTALITNEGFRDVLAIGTQMRTHVYDLWTPEPEPDRPAGAVRQRPRADRRPGRRAGAARRAERARRRRKAPRPGRRGDRSDAPLLVPERRPRAAGGGDPGRGAARRRRSPSPRRSCPSSGSTCAPPPLRSTPRSCP